MARAGVQIVIVAGGAFVLGLVVGGIGPRGDVRELEREVFELRRAGAEQRGGGTAAGEELAKLITAGIAPATADAAPQQPEPRRPGATLPEEIGGGEAPPVPKKPQDPLKAAREVLELRRTQARAALVEDVDPTGDQLDEIDGLIGAMNRELESVARQFVLDVGDGPEPTRRQLMMAAADVLDVLAASEERMLQVLTPEQRDGVREEATDPTSYVDPTVLDILAEAVPREAHR